MVHRRTMLTGSLGWTLRAAPAIRRELFLASPGGGVAVMAYAFYTRPTGGEMICIEQRWSRSDTVDVAFVRHSSDYGQKWSAPVEIRTGESRADGMLRRHPRAGYVDPSGRYVEFFLQGVLPTDNPLEGQNFDMTFSRQGCASG